MYFEEGLIQLKQQIKNAQDESELDYLKAVNEKKYWWTSIFVAGLFYALNGSVKKMIITWIVGIITFGIYVLYVIYTSYRDQIEFNNEMELSLLNRRKELKNKSATPQISSDTVFCSSCGEQLDATTQFCPKCGNELQK